MDKYLLYIQKGAVYFPTAPLLEDGKIDAYIPYMIEAAVDEK